MLKVSQLVQKQPFLKQAVGSGVSFKLLRKVISDFIIKCFEVLNVSFKWVESRTTHSVNLRLLELIGLSLGLRNDCD